MAQMVLIIGESGTGKSASLRNCDSVTTAVVNPVGKPLPFKNKFDMLNNVTDARKICKYMHEQVAAGKKLIAVDDFQYILAVPYMNRIKETGWDKYNDFGANYFEIIEVCKELPDDVVVVYFSHLETLENGLTTVKLIGKLLREKITIEGLFTVVLRTGVAEGKYYFYTQNSGRDTVKSPISMFPAYAIDNDMNYVADKIRNYYEVGEYKSDEEIAQADVTVAADVTKPNSNGRRARGEKGVVKTETATPPQPVKESKSRKTHNEVVKENQEKMTEYQEQVNEAIDKIARDREEVPFDEAMDAANEVPQPDIQTPPRRTRGERKAMNGQVSENTLMEDTYFYIKVEDNYVMKHKGDIAPEGGQVITKEEFGEGIKRLAAPETPVTRRTRKTR